MKESLYHVRSASKANSLCELCIAIAQRNMCIHEIACQLTAHESCAIKVCANDTKACANSLWMHYCTIKCVH